MKYAVLILLGLVVGYWLADYFQEDTVFVKTVTETKTDTVYVEVRDTIRLTRTEIKHEVLRDTVLIDFQPQIKRVTASKPFLHGNTYVYGEVLGEVLKMDITNTFNFPTITNTITTTNTVIKNPAGLFITAGVGDRNFSTPYIGAVFVKDRVLIGLNTSGVQIGWKVSKR